MDWNEQSDTFARIEDVSRTDLWRWMEDRIRRERPEQLLDYGCGDGRFLARCAELPVRTIVGYDSSPRMREIAALTTADRANVRVVDRTDLLPVGGADLITLNAVWMCLESDAECCAVLGEVRRLLRPEGLLLASVTHPCFRRFAFSTFQASFDDRSYLADGAQFTVRFGDDHGQMEITDTHWSLAAMTSQLRRSGFFVEEIVEFPDGGAPEPAPGSPWLVLICRPR
jgi:trans-aconitate methyltransferase